MPRKFSKQEIDEWTGRWAALREKLLWALDLETTSEDLLLVEVQSRMDATTLHPEHIDAEEPTEEPASRDCGELLLETLRAKTLAICGEGRKALLPCLTWLREVHKAGPVEHRGNCADCWSELILNLIENSKSFDAEFLYRALDLELTHAAMNELEAMGRRTAPGEANDTDMTWPKAALILERLRLQGEEFTSQGRLGKQIGCSPSTINRAIKETPSLRAWAGRQVAPKVVKLSELVADNQPQRREALPDTDLEERDVDAVFAKLLDRAAPAERAKLHAAPHESRRELAKIVANNPDLSDLVWLKK